jgi:hypothetical protein
MTPDDASDVQDTTSTDTSTSGSASDTPASGSDPSAAAQSSSGSDTGSSGSSGDGGGSASGAGSSGDGSSGSSNGSSGDGSSGSGSTGSSSSGASGSGADGSSGDQTPADQLTLDTIQPASTSADTSQTQTASTGDTGAVAADAPSGGGGVSVSDIIAIGTTVAKIMAASTADYTMRDNPVSVIPKDVDPLALTGVADPPRELRIPLNYHNRIGMLVCNLPIVVQWRYNGSYKGAGRFITNASAFLDSGADTGMFYKADVNATMTGPRNAGADSSNPTAAIDVHIEVKVTDKTSPANLFIVLEGSIQGDGAGTLRQRPN